MTTNVDIVRDVYARFAAGDVDEILALWHDDDMRCQCCTDLTADDIAIAGPRLGKPGLVGLLDDYKSAIDYELYEPRDFRGDGDMVFVTGRYEGTIKKTGRRFASDWVHVYRLKDRRLVTFQEFCDTAAMKAAAAP